MRHATVSGLGLVLVLAGSAAALPACDSLYYKTMKKFGVEKRDILVKRVREAREAQQEGKEEFRSALDRFKSVVETEGGSLEDKYNELNRQLERSEDRASRRLPKPKPSSRRWTPTPEPRPNSRGCGARD
jgi:Protein of unknown function (DUF2959)